MAEMNRRGAIKWTVGALLLLALVAPIGAAPNTNIEPPDLGDCEEVEVPAGNRVTARVFALGVQVYRWDGTSWVFVEPRALFFDEDYDFVGIHYAGPTWDNQSSKVVGAVDKRCTLDPTAIPWLLLKAVSSQGRGMFRDVTYIQRINTVGGLAPTDPGDFEGEVVWVPYAAEYYFYRASK